MKKSDGGINIHKLGGICSGDLFKTIKDKQRVVFLKNRAGEPPQFSYLFLQSLMPVSSPFTLPPNHITDLILEVESTMKKNEVEKFSKMPPFLHILQPINLEASKPEDGGDLNR